MKKNFNACEKIVFIFVYNKYVKIKKDNEVFK